MQYNVCSTLWPLSLCTDSGDGEVRPAYLVGFFRILTPNLKIRILTLKSGFQFEIKNCYERLLLESDLPLALK